VNTPALVMGAFGPSPSPSPGYAAMVLAIALLTPGFTVLERIELIGCASPVLIEMLRKSA
jgi:hypothetical protein